MADRDNDDDRNGRKKRKFSIDDDAFESDDDVDFMSDDEFEKTQLFGWVLGTK